MTEKNINEESKVDKWIKANKKDNFKHIEGISFTDQRKTMDEKEFHNNIKQWNLIEQLSELEHEQWMTWAKSITETTIEPALLNLDFHKTRDILKERIQRWLPNMIPYSNLSEEIKEFDRIWARKVLEICHASELEFLEKHATEDFDLRTFVKDIAGRIAWLKKEIGDKE